MGFHAGQEAARVLAMSMDLSRQGQVAIRDPSFKPRLPQPRQAGASPYPDIPAPAANAHTPGDTSEPRPPGK